MSRLSIEQDNYQGQRVDLVVEYFGTSTKEARDQIRSMIKKAAAEALDTIKEIET